MSRTLHAKHIDAARQENERFQARVQEAMDYTSAALGHNAWSRDLNDYCPAYAFCVPPSLYEDAELSEELLGWLARTFGCHYITFAVCEWRQSSADPIWCANSMYEVDWLGSRSRSVNIGPHLYLEFAPRLLASKPPLDPGSPPALPLWYTRTTEPDNYTVNIRTVPVADAAELALMIRRAEVHDSVLMAATSVAWRMWRGRRIPVAANYSNDENWIGDVQWTQVGNSGDAVEGDL